MPRFDETLELTRLTSSVILSPMPINCQIANCAIAECPDPVSFDVLRSWNIAIALLGGLAVGIERQWSGHALGPRARFAGLRTFTMLGLVAGLSGWLWMAGLQGPAVVFLAGVGALVVVAYLSASRKDVDGTTEVAAFVVLAAGVLAGAGQRTVASAIIAITVLLLVEKKGLHRLVGKLDRVEVQAGARFAVMAAVILPLLPAGPYGPFGGVKPRQLWALVLFFSGISFVGYIARRAVGRAHGYALAGTLGGLLSSTSVTLAFVAAQPQHARRAGVALAAGALGASVVLFPRVLVASAVLAPPLARAHLAALHRAGRHRRRARRLRPAAIGRRQVARPGQEPAAVRGRAADGGALPGGALPDDRSCPDFGSQGLFASSAVLGLTDMDALTVSMARLDDHRHRRRRHRQGSRDRRFCPTPSSKC